MNKLQFHVLYRQFLFRMVDLELLSANAQGDSSKLLGQFASLLVFIGLLLGALHTAIATTMLAVGLFTVLSWDSMFLDRRDVLVLAPLPIAVRTLFLAKVSALGTALGATVLAVNALPGIYYPVLSAGPYPGGVLNMIFSLALWRAFVSYWITMCSAGALIFCSVLLVQGSAAYLLPRRHFLRFSAFLQLAAFCLFVSVYFLQPSFVTPRAIADPRNQSLLALLPSYWFFGLYHMLNGTSHPALLPLARRGIAGLAIVTLGAAVAFLLAYFRTVRKIVEEPDIVASSRGGHWSPRLGTLLETALVLFSVRTLLRSRQHRVLLCFYLGVAFAVVIALMKAPMVRQNVSVPMMVSSIVALCLWVFGTRVVFSMPRELLANWIFRVAPLRSGPECLAANRRTLFVLAAAPVWAGSAVLFLSTWPWREAMGHLTVLLLLGIILADLCLHQFRKIPFTCSYLPGKSHFHMAFWGFGMLLVTLIAKSAEWEWRALQNWGSYVKLLLVLCLATALARWRTRETAYREDAALQFEEMGETEIAGLGLHRDGVMPVESPAAVIHPHNSRSLSAQPGLSD